MTFQPGATVYTQGFGSRPENVEVPHLDVRAPTTTDIMYPIGKTWVDQTNNAAYTLTSFSTSSNVTTATWVTTGGGSGAVATLTGDTGTATPTGGNIKIAGTANQITTTASGSTVALALAGPYTPATYTAHGVLLGEGTSSIVATSAGTSGQPLLSGGAGADPNWGTLGVAFGGSGDTSHTAYAVLCGGTTATGAVQSVSGVGTSGQVLTSGGAGMLPAFLSMPASSITLDGDSGHATGGTLTITGGTTGLTVTGDDATTLTLGGTLDVANGGTGDTTLTAYAVMCGGTSSTAHVQSVASVGTSGQVLTSNGAGALPTFQAAGGGSGALTLIQTQTATLATTLTFTTGLTYNNYFLVGINVNDPTTLGSPNIIMQVSIDGGSTYIATGYFNQAGAGAGMILSNFNSNTSFNNFNGYIDNFRSGAGYITSNTLTTLYDTTGPFLGGNNVEAAYTVPSTVANAFQLLTDDATTFNGVFTLYGYTT